MGGGWLGGGGWARTGLGIIESPQHSTFQRKGGNLSQNVPLSAEMLNIVFFLVVHTREMCFFLGKC